jgi:hypothetical protein
MDLPLIVSLLPAAVIGLKLLKSVFFVFWFPPILDVTTGLRVFSVELVVRMCVFLTAECPFILYEAGCK